MNEDEVNPEERTEAEKAVARRWASRDPLTVPPEGDPEVAASVARIRQRRAGIL